MFPISTARSAFCDMDAFPSSSGVVGATSRYPPPQSDHSRRTTVQDAKIERCLGSIDLGSSGPDEHHKLLPGGLASSASNTENGDSILGFLKDKGFDDKSIHGMFKKWKHLETAKRERVSENWDFLREIGIPERKLPSVVAKCPKILVLGLQEKLVPMIRCLATLGTKPREVASAVTKFPHILVHSVEEKLCPLLAFFQSLGVSENQLGKMILLNPRLISYSIDSKLTEIVQFLVEDIGLPRHPEGEDHMIAKVLVRNPFIMGYSVDRRLRPTLQFLQSVGLTKSHLQSVALNFSQVLCRDVDKVLKPNLTYLKDRRFRDEHLVSLIAGCPLILIKSIRNSLEPRIRFLTEVMGRQIDEVMDYPQFFGKSLKKTLELRYKVLKQGNRVDTSLSEMLDCSQKNFLLRFGS